MKDYHYVYGINSGAVMSIRLFKNKKTFKSCLKLKQQKNELMTIYQGRILDDRIVWNKPRFPK